MCQGVTGSLRGENARKQRAVESSEWTLHPDEHLTRGDSFQEAYIAHISTSFSLELEAKPQLSEASDLKHTRPGGTLKIEWSPNPPTMSVFLQGGALCNLWA